MLAYKSNPEWMNIDDIRPELGDMCIFIGDESVGMIMGIYRGNCIDSCCETYDINDAKYWIPTPTEYPNTSI